MKKKNTILECRGGEPQSLREFSPQNSRPLDGPGSSRFLKFLTSFRGYKAKVFHHFIAIAVHVFPVKCSRSGVWQPETTSLESIDWCSIWNLNPLSSPKEFQICNWFWFDSSKFWWHSSSWTSYLNFSDFHWTNISPQHTPKNWIQPSKASSTRSPRRSRREVAETRWLPANQPLKPRGFQEIPKRKWIIKPSHWKLSGERC